MGKTVELHGLRKDGIDHYLIKPLRANEIVVETNIQSLGNDRLPFFVEMGLYRLIQEALTNVIRHAKAKTVSVQVQQEGTHIRIVIADDGVGFDVEALLQSPLSEQNLGLHGMHERASLLNGSLIIESMPGQGTTVYIDIPCPNKDNDGSENPERQ